MIGRLTGRVALKAADHAMIDVGGVGYVVHCSDRTLAGLPPVGEIASVWTELLVREDLLQLFGFLSPEDREWHRLLTSVQGVGAKAAMAILGTLEPAALARAVAIGDWGSVKAAPGIGPKIAQRVVNELKDKAPAAMAMGARATAPAAPQTLVTTDAGPSDAPAVALTDGAAQAEALSALTNLGYALTEAASAVARAAGAQPGSDTPTLIRAALRLLAPKE
ncbi:Holliday junction branch migration protein RuvA [Rhodobacterales bacterium HKCCE3408]|nr:Holliday junction branch migration protein RuvA [Rhodobacterales bacterium HKCCE3408]